MPGLAATVGALLLAACGPGRLEPERSSTRVLVYNIHAGADAEGERNLERVAEILRFERVDIALLQEVDRGTQRSGGVDQPEVLAGLTDLRPVFGRTLDYQGGEYGIALLSALPVTEWEIVPMAVEPPQQRAGGSYEPRGILRATLDAPPGRLHVLNTHLDASRDDHYRQQEVRQLVALAERLRGAGGAVMLGGDLNAEPGSPVIRVLTAAGWRDAWTECGSGEGLTFPSRAPVKRIDYLFLSPDLRCTSARVLESDASDHLGLLVELEPSGSRDP